jgi:SAM-dependent methyltransferase
MVNRSISELNYEGRDLEVLADMPNYYAWIMEYFSSHVMGNVIEYGAGSGTVSERLAPLAKMLTLVEPSPNLVETLRARFAKNSSIVVQGESLETHVSQIKAGSIDTVVMVNVLEHIEDDEEALARLFNALSPNGKLLIFVPALNFLMSKLDLIHGHFRRYYKGNLVSKVQGAGGQIILCRYFDLPGVVPWFVLNKLMGSTAFNPWLVRLNDQFVVPASRAIERPFPPPFGKNLILVASRQ